MNDDLRWLQKWYASRCDGDWEHEYGIRIETIDNPGWVVEINLSGTEYESRNFEDVRIDLGPEDWIRCSKKGNDFIAHCSSLNLDKVLVLFRRWIGDTPLKLKGLYEELLKLKLPLFSNQDDLSDWVEKLMEVDAYYAGLALSVAEGDKVILMHNPHDLADLQCSLNVIQPVDEESALILKDCQLYLGKLQEINDLLRYLL